MPVPIVEKLTFAIEPPEGPDVGEAELERLLTDCHSRH
jgi:hypothetical protein